MGLDGPSDVKANRVRAPSPGQFMPVSWRIHQGPKSLVFEAWGEIDLLEVPRFQEALLGSVSPGTPFVLDLRGVTYLELRALPALERASARATEFVIIPSKIVRRIIEVLDLEETLTLKDASPFDEPINGVIQEIEDS